MTNRIGPMDQSSISKLGGKVDEAKTSGTQGSTSAPANPASGKASSGGDTVQLTSGAQLLSRLEQTLANSPSVDAAKVAEVKAAIAEGNYEIDSGAIADAMIRFERSLGE